MAKWSPIDERIAFVSRTLSETDETGFESSVVVSSHPGRERHALLTVDSLLLSGLAWSGDARFLATLALRVSLNELTSIFDPPEGTIHVTPSDSSESDKTAMPGKYMGFTWVSASDGPTILATTLSRDGSFETVFIDPKMREVREITPDLIFPGGKLHPDLLSPDGKTLAALRGKYAHRIVCIDVESARARELDPHGEVAWLGWHPQTGDLAVLVRTREGVKLEMIPPEGERRTVVTFARSEFFDVPEMVISADGKLAAIEVHLSKDD